MTSHDQTHAGDPCTTWLLDRYGPLIGGLDLARVAGFPTVEALKVAAKRGLVGFDLFAVPGRRGRFAKTTAVADWLAGLGSKPTATAKATTITKT